MNKLIETAPDQIYLNVGIETEEETDFKELSEVTWSANRIFGNDIEYQKVKENYSFYTYKGNRYKVLDYCKGKHPETGKWVVGVYYQCTRTQERYWREQEDFNKKFILNESINLS